MSVWPPYLPEAGRWDSSFAISPRSAGLSAIGYPKPADRSAYANAVCWSSLRTGCLSNPLTLVCQPEAVEDLVSQPLHPLLASRWSPTTFDPVHEIAPSAVELLVEAARWAPSAGNSQPWAFILGRRGAPTHQRLVRYLAGSSRGWASTASLLVANLCHRYVEGTDWEYSEFAVYDLGQAVAHMTLQARALGLFVRQFRAFDRAGLTTEFAVPRHWEVTTMAAIGRVPPHLGDPTAMDPAEAPVRQRRTIDEIMWSTV